MSKKENKIIFTRKIKKEKIAKKEDINKILIENFVNIQRVMTEFSEKFEKLSNHISNLLNVFEESAKTLVKKEFEIVRENPNIELTSKIDKILDQNKIIAKGLSLIYEKPQTNQQMNNYPPNPIYKEEIKKSISNKIEEKPKLVPMEKNQQERSPIFEIP